MARLLFVLLFKLILQKYVNCNIYMRDAYGKYLPLTSKYRDNPLLYKLGYVDCSAHLIHLKFWLVFPILHDCIMHNSQFFQCAKILQNSQFLIKPRKWWYFQRQIQGNLRLIGLDNQSVIVSDLCSQVQICSPFYKLFLIDFYFIPMV